MPGQTPDVPNAVAGAQRSERPRSHRIQNALVGAAILAELVLVAGHPLFGWGAKHYAATPKPLVYGAPLPPSGRGVLSSLAAAAATQPTAAATAQTPYAYVMRRWWRLPAARSGQRPSSKVLPTVSQAWTAADGAGRIARSTSTARGTLVRDTLLGPGQPLPQLPASETVLAQRLGWQYPTAAPSAREFVEYTQLADREPVTGLVQAGLLQLLARIPGVINAGKVTDRNGRPGVAVSIQSGDVGSEILYTLIFDPATGGLLEADETLAGDAGALDVLPGSVLAYTTWLASGYVSSTTARP